MAEKLGPWGIDVYRGIGRTGVVGILHGTGGLGRRIGLAREAGPHGRSLSVDLRLRVLAAIADGLSGRQAAAWFVGTLSPLQ